jgi:Domain of unknown function (DUF4249)
MEIKLLSHRHSYVSYSLIIAFLCILSCKKDTTIANYDLPVVEGYLIPGQPIRIKVYYQKYLEDTLSYGYPITDLHLAISNGTNSVNLTEIDSGTYQYADHTFIKENGHYTLSFMHLNKKITASTSIPSKPLNFKVSSTEQEIPTFSIGSTPSPFVPIHFSWTNTNLENYYMLSFQNIEADPTRIDSRRPRSNPNMEVLVGQVASYYTSQENFTYLGNHNVLLFRINKEYNEALKSSGTRSLNLTNPYTNVVNGLGIFTGLTADTLHINVYQ